MPEAGESRGVRAAAPRLLVLGARQPVARNPRGVKIDELFLISPWVETPALRNPTGSRSGQFFLALDRVLKAVEEVNELQKEVLADKLKQAQMKFIIEPHIRFKGQVGEQATMFFLDPCGNALEFKAFADPSRLFAK